MHLYIITRGHKLFVDEFITQMQGKYLPYKWKKKQPDGTEKVEDTMLQVAVRPIQLWEIAFPQEHLDTMMATIFRNEYTAGAYSYPKEFMKLTRFGMRKALKAKPLPKKWDSSKWLPVLRENVSILGIGIKEDVPHEFGEGI